MKGKGVIEDYYLLDSQIPCLNSLYKWPVRFPRNQVLGLTLVYRRFIEECSQQSFVFLYLCGEKTGKAGLDRKKVRSGWGGNSGPSQSHKMLWS